MSSLRADSADAATSCGTGMHLSDHDLFQLDDAYLATLTPEQARALLSREVTDLQAARERLAQSPLNSSRPPSSRAPWEGIEEAGEEDGGGEARVHSAHYTLDLVRPDGGAGGLVLHQSKHVYRERRCTCGHWTRAQPARCAEDGAWTVALSEWHLAGPSLVAFICALTQRMRLSRARVREFLADRLGLSLSTATINQCVHEAARAVEPVVEQAILERVRNVELAEVLKGLEEAALVILHPSDQIVDGMAVLVRRDRQAS
jgi:hypothetical protein